MNRCCSSLREHARNKFNFEKTTTKVTVNKRRPKITPRCKKLLDLWQKNLEKYGVYYHYTGKYRAAL